MRILVAEDDPRLGPSLKKGLEDNHYAVDLVTDGEEALSVALAVSFNLIILDILLPRIDGFEVCRQLRNQVCVRYCAVKGPQKQRNCVSWILHWIHAHMK